MNAANALRKQPAAREGAFDGLTTAVQANCDLADAVHAREKSLCTYLLGMREYFRWSTQLPLATAPDRSRLGEWIAQREHDWDQLRDRADPAFRRLPLAGGIDPFDDTAANRELGPQGLVYGAGVGLFGAPMFFLARRESEQLRDGVRVIVTGHELARGITAAPAVSRLGEVVIRRDALRRWLWTRAETALRGPRDNAFAQVLQAYGGADVAAAVGRMSEGETETLVLHELGELRAGELLGAEWEEMLLGIDRRPEVVLRAVRDLLADCLVTLPVLTERAAIRSLHFWLATFDGLRRTLAPDLAESFRDDADRIDLSGLERASRSGQEIWHARARGLLDCWRRGGAEAVTREAERLVA